MYVIHRVIKLITDGLNNYNCSGVNFWDKYKNPYETANCKSGMSFSDKFEKSDESMRLRSWNTKWYIWICECSTLMFSCDNMRISMKSRREFIFLTISIRAKKFVEIEMVSKYMLSQSPHIPYILGVFEFVQLVALGFSWCRR